MHIVSIIFSQGVPESKELMEKNAETEKFAHTNGHSVEANLNNSKSPL